MTNDSGTATANLTNVQVACTNGSQFAYVANFGTNNVSAYSIGANGALTPVAGSPFTGGNLPRLRRRGAAVSGGRHAPQGHLLRGADEQVAWPLSSV